MTVTFEQFVENASMILRSIRTSTLISYLQAEILLSYIADFGVSLTEKQVLEIHDLVCREIDHRMPVRMDVR